MSAEKVRVVAPATLGEGYSFEAQVDGQAFVVLVPEGGVKEGQEFEVPYPTFDSDDGHCSDEYGSQQEEQEEDPMGAPRGEWRTRLCWCCDVVTQATFWMSCLCMPVFVAQILTRMSLSWRGEQASPYEVSMTFNRVTMSYIAVLFIAAWLVPLAGVVLVLLFSVYMLYIALFARKVMRKKYDIPAGPLGDMMEDCCCVFVCPCCTTIQMARHTHNDKEWPGTCCTVDGLEQGAPDI